MTVHRPGLAALTSLIAEDFTATPSRISAVAEEAAVADPENRWLHLIDLAYAALLAGEPKRALRVIQDIAAHSAASDTARHCAALHSWAIQLDSNWYPGNVGAELPSPAPTITPTGGVDETVLVEYVVAHGPVALLTPRAIIAAAQGQQNTSAANQMADTGIQILQPLLEHARAIGAVPAWTWAALAQADLAYRTGRTDPALGVLAEVRTIAENAALTAMLVVSYLLEGDWAATPESSPEAMGFHLAVRPAPSPQPASSELARAAECFAVAERLALSVDAAETFPMVWAAIQLRWATLAWFRRDHIERRRRLDAARKATIAAGNNAYRCLVDVQLLIADLADGKLSAVAGHVGNGWGATPSGSQLAAIRSWAERDGSTGWCIGLGRLLERAGDGWRADSQAEPASLAYLGALALYGIRPDFPALTVAAAISGLDARRNLSARALIRLERILASAPALNDLRAQVMDAFQEIEILASIVSVQRSRQRTPAAEHAARGLERVAGRLRAILIGAGEAGIAVRTAGTLRSDRAALGALMDEGRHKNLDNLLETAGEDSAETAMLSMMVGQAGAVLSQVEMLVPLARGENAQRRGLTQRADAFFDAALDASKHGPAYQVPLVLVAAGRYEQARSEIDRLAQAGAFDDDILALLALRADAPLTARAAFDRSGADPLATADWRIALTGAELEQDDPGRAHAIARHGIALLETAIGRLTRDIDRVAACDDPDLPALYLTATKACLRLATLSPDTSASQFAQAFEYVERARSLAIDHLLSGERARHTAEDPIGRWQQAAAEWTIDVDRLLAGIDESPPADTGPLLALVDSSEAQLRRLEGELDQFDPTLLLEYRRPAAPLRLGTVQERLPVRSALLEYHTIGDDLVIAAVTPAGIQIEHRSVRGRELAAVVRDYHVRCADGFGRGDAEARLSGLLLEPVADVVRDAERLIVVPFGPLNLVPLHALPFDGAPLGLGRVVSYAPAAAVGASPDRVVRLERVAIVGDPAFDARRHPRLRRLPGARTEARLVAARLGSADVVTDVAATESAVRGLLTDRTVIHLATHGWLDELAPYGSSLVLAGEDELTVAELIGIHLGADLAVLSACDTGRGAATLGGDVVGLTRALLASGVRGAVVSLWPVDDITACVTMATFYERLRHVPPAFALADAQRAVYELDRAGLRSRYAELCAEAGTSAVDAGESRRRGETDEDDEPIPAPLGGSAERHWAPFVLIGAS